jgi:hypothetical protein
MNISTYLILNKKKYFSIAEEYVGLQQLFQKETVFEKLSIIVDMLIYPLFMIGSVIFYQQEMTLFTVMSIHKTVTIWLNWIRYMELSQEINEWKNIVRSVGGPFISCNDPTYHVYVYADGMQRLHDTLFVLPKKGTKRL